MLVLAPLAAVILFACVQTALAAVQLNFFNVIAFPTSVMLEWSTASEVNLAGFDIQCKQANEADTAYHEIGFQPAKGGPNVGALYDFPVTSGLVPGNSYCFRLKEVTTDGSPGEVFDRCGYGPMVTPTPGFGAIPVFTPVPVQTDAFGNPIVPTPTPQVPVVATDAFGNPITQIPGAVPTDAFGNPIPPTPFNPTSPLAPPQAVATDAFGNPLPPTPAPQAVATDAFGNPLPATPVPQAVATDAFGNPLPPTPAPQAVATDAFGNPVPTASSISPLPTPSVAAAAAYDAYGNPIATPVQAAAVATDMYGNPVDAFGNPLPPQGGAPLAENSQPAQPGQAAAPEYVQP
ncbi:MAG: hypothetical protein U0X20_32200, partial [Caldilineaceae bacterium]